MRTVKILTVFLFGLYLQVSADFAQSQCSPVVDQQQNTWTSEYFAYIGQQECYDTQEVQSFQPSYNNVTGVEVRLSQGPGLTFKIGLFNALPITGATPLAEATIATQTSGTAQYVIANWGKVSVTPGQTYYFGYCWVGGSQNQLAGASGNPYPGGLLYGLGGSLDFGGDFDLTFKTFSENCVNNPPVLNTVGSEWGTEGNLLSFTLSATDPDGDVLTYSAIDLPDGASLDANTGVFSWTPKQSQVGYHYVRFIVSDGYFENSQLAAIGVFDTGQGGVEALKWKKAVAKETTPSQGNVRVVEYAKEELKSTFGVTASFENLEPPTATVTVTTFNGCPTSPNGFRVGDMCLDIITAAVSYSSVQICITYDDTTINSENALKLQHYEVNHWVDVPVTQDTVANIICGTINSLSPLMITSSLGDTVAPIDPQPVHMPVTVSADFIDPNAIGNYKVEINWGDGFFTNYMMEEPDGVGTASASYEYMTPGVYTITLRMYYGEDTLLGESIYRYVVIFDPNGGFVTGGGWIDSPPGAYVPDSALTGKASFGFVSKYKKGATVPSGDTQFQFNAAGMDFVSTSYQWLVISGARAQYKGFGTINGQGSYGFLLTAIDGNIAGGGGVDKFRIKIWDPAASDAIVYDNQIGAADDGLPTNALGGGSIVIHKE